METKQETLEEYNERLKKMREEGKPVIKNIQGKQLILKGVLDKLTITESKFGGENARLEMGGFNYYFNAKTKGIAEKMFSVGDLVAFTVKESPNRNNPLKPYLVIEQVFYTF